MVYSGLSDSTTMSQFTRLKYIYVTTDGTSTPTNYQVKLTIAYEPEMQADFGDIRFNTLGHTYIDYWIESKTNGVTADVWVELPDAITHPGSDTIWMYYGNAGLSGGSDGDATFTQWHGAATADYLDSLIVSVPFIHQARSRRTGASEGNYLGVSDVQVAYTSEAILIAPYDTVTYRDSVEGGIQEYTAHTVWNLNQWYNTKIEAISDSLIDFYLHNTTTKTGSNTVRVPNGNMGLVMYELPGGQIEQEWSFVRKYITNEPTISYGASQHQRRVSQFIN